MNPALTPPVADPLAMLQAAHVRIHAQLALLERLAGRLDDWRCDAEARGAAQMALEYFDTEGALHHEDEDGDLFPLLRVRAAACERAEIAALIDELEREHAIMKVQWQRLRQSLAQIVAGEGLLDAGEVERFAWGYRRHMDNENAAVLPFAREALHPDDCTALGERMAARRNNR